MDELDREPATGGTIGWDDTGTRADANRDATTRPGDNEGRSGTAEQGGIGELVAERVDEGRERLSQVVESGKNRLADQLERVGDRIEDRARSMDESGGMQRRAGSVVHGASAALDTSAAYIRTHDPADMRDDLERAIRERPLLSMGVAVGAGFLLARLLRD